MILPLHHSGLYSRAGLDRKASILSPEGKQKPKRPPVPTSSSEKMIIMTYVAYEEKSAAQREADRKANERWMRDHAEVHEVETPSYYRPGVVAAGYAASAH